MANEDAATNFRHGNGYGSAHRWCVLVAVTLAVCTSVTLAYRICRTDEPRYAWDRRRHGGAATGSRACMAPWFAKPVLYYGWPAQASTFGVSEAAARLPAHFALCSATLALAWLAWRVYGAETARAFASAAKQRRYDRFLARSCNRHAISAQCHNRDGLAAVVLRLTRNENSRFSRIPPGPHFLLFGFSGLAVLAKAHGNHPLWRAVSSGAPTKKWRTRFACFIHRYCLFAQLLPWYILCSRRNLILPRLHIEHNFKRYSLRNFNTFNRSGTTSVVLMLLAVERRAPLVDRTRIGRVNAGRVLHHALFLLTWVCCSHSFQLQNEIARIRFLLCRLSRCSEPYNRSFCVKKRRSASTVASLARYFCWHIPAEPPS